MSQLSAFSTSLPAFVILSSIWAILTGEVILHGGFDLHFPGGWCCGAFLHMFSGPFCVLFSELSAKVLCPVLYWIGFVVVVIEFLNLLIYY